MRKYPMLTKPSTITGSSKTSTIPSRTVDVNE
jgi:hypothetical protein